MICTVTERVMDGCKPSLIVAVLTSASPSVSGGTTSTLYSKATSSPAGTVPCQRTSLRSGS